MGKLKVFYFFYSIFLLKLIFSIKNISKTDSIKNKIIQKKYHNRNDWILFYLCYLSFTSFVTISYLILQKRCNR